MTFEQMTKEQTPAETLATLRRLVNQMAGQRLPSERDLAMRLRVSRPRVRAGLETLRREGLVEARHGSGTYAIDLAAAGLRKVVLLIDDNLKLSDDPFFSLLMEMLQTELQTEGMRCLVERFDSGSLPGLEDGALTLGLAGSSVIARLRSNDPPVVGLLLDTEVRPRRRASIFQLEDRRAGCDAAEALLQVGCRDILFIGRENIPASRERYTGVAEAANAADVRLHFVASHLNYQDGVRLGCEMDLPLGEGPLGIVATNDWLAVGLQNGLHRREKTAGRSIKIVSFDGLPVTADPSLGIDSLAVPVSVIAADAVAELRRLHGSGGSEGRIVRYPLQWARRPEEYTRDSWSEIPRLNERGNS
jgi:DNA-binding LacI/PurR family transcriptional regulator